MAETLPIAPKEAYQADLRQLDTAAAPAWLKELRRTGAERLAELDFPSRRQEEWRYTNIAPIVSSSFRFLLDAPGALPAASELDSILFRQPGWTELVFVNGHFAPSLSSQGASEKDVRAGSLRDAIASDDAVVREHLNHYLNDGNVFAALNTVFLQDGAFIHVPAKRVLNGPIHVVHIRTAQEGPSGANPRHLVVLDAQAEAAVVESYVDLTGSGIPYFNNVATEVSLGPGARLHWHKLVQEGHSGYHLGTMRVQQARDSYFRAFTITLSGKIVRNEISVLLDGEGGEASLNGVYLTQGDQLVDNATSIEHAQPHCRSWIGYKGVLDGESHAVFSGKVKVRRLAVKTDSNQLNNNLLLSDHAAINTKPLLEIYADDVKCTHGATVGQHPPEVIFYFRARGMSEAMARAMLTYGFADQIINQIEVGPLRSRLDKAVYDRYSPI